MRKRQVLVELPKPDFEVLAALARQEEREVYQQASYLLIQVLRRPREDRPPGEEAGHAA